ncbi:MAG: 50S ribosomal protein L11 methyltransferase, partial [candidate division Zixibacteria bacterium]|nr:50S ribosomal protein L11 methyltransferase [candidate division Zixibacteria bacterium]
MNSADGDTMFIEVRVTVDHEVVDALCDIIIENFSPGLILEDEEDSSVTTIKFYHPGSDADEYLRRVSAFLSRLPAFQTARTAEIRSRTVSSVDWEQQYRDSIESIGIEPGIVVRPPWQEPIGSALYDIVVEPKMAFGTGRHETTRCCLKVIAERFQPGWRFLDLGCGSGILSILADKLSASFIKGIDYDPEAVDNCRENFQLNNVAAPFEILLGSIELCRFDPP